MPNRKLTRETWAAMIKFADNEPLTPSEWTALSWLTLIDRNRLEFGPGNIRWATTEAERADNLAFFKKLGVQLMSKLIDITGQRFGRLVVLRFSHSDHEAWFACRCDCGTEKTMRGSSLRSSLTRSCGCLAHENAHSRKHNHAHKGRKSKTYSVWVMMRQRCLNPHNKDWKYYGGRGIEICQRWLSSFEAFLADMGEKPPGLTLDRNRQ